MEFKEIVNSLDNALYHSLITLGNYANSILIQAQNYPHNNYTLDEIELTFLNQSDVSINLFLTHPKRTSRKEVNSYLAEIYLEPSILSHIKELERTFEDESFLFSANSIQYHLKKENQSPQVSLKYSSNLESNLKLLLGNKFFIKYEKEYFDNALLCAPIAINQEKIKL